MAKSTTPEIPLNAPENAAASTEMSSASGAPGPVTLRKRALVDRVVAASGMKKKDVKPVVEATLAVLGDALSNEEPMNLQPLGKVMINRRKQVNNGEVVVTRIRRSVPSAQMPDMPPLAEPAEGS